jgi:hypothetical protein
MKSKYYFEGRAAYSRGITTNPYTNGDDERAAEHWQDGFDACEQEFFDNEYVTNVRSRNVQWSYE